MNSESLPRPSVSTAAIAGCLALSMSSSAAVFTWDADGIAPLSDGAASWNATGGTNWNTASTYGAWGNTTADEAVFGVANGAAGTVTVGTVSVNKLTFNAAGSGNYMLSGGTITLGGTTPTIAATANAGISSALAGTGLTKTGAGTLSLSGTGTISGDVIVKGATSQANTLAILSGADLGVTNLYLRQDNVSSDTLAYNQTGGAVTVSNEFVIGHSTTGGGSGWVNGATISGGTTTVNGMLALYKWANSSLTVSGSGVVNANSLRIGWVDSSPVGTINVGDGTAFSGGTSINDGGSSGTLKVNTWSIQNNRSYALNFKGGTLKAGAAGASWLPANAFSATAGANVQEAGGIIDNGGFAITIAQALKHGGVAATDGGLVFKGNGTTTLTGAISYTGPTKVAAGTLATAMTLGDVSVANTAALQGGVAGVGTLTAGNLTLGGGASDSVSLKGALSATAGYKAIAVNNLTLNGGNGSVNLDVTGSGLTLGNTYDFLVSTNPITAPNASSVVAALKVNSRSLSPVVDGTGTKIQLLYSAADSIYWTGANGTAWNASDTNWKLTASNGNAQFMNNDVVLFHDGPVNNTVDISGGNVTPSATTFDNTIATDYTLQGTNGIASGTITKSNGGLVTITNTNPTTGAVVLNGGSVEISQSGGLGTGSLTFDGGSLAYTGASTIWTRALAVNLGGGTLDVASGTTLTANGGISGTGALTKTGVGVFTVNAVNVGATLVVNEGSNFCNTGDGIKGFLKINEGATFGNTAPHIFSRPGSRVWINGGTLNHGPAGFPEFYIPQGTSSADPGLQMTGGILGGGGDTRFDPGTGYITTNAASTTALISGSTTNYQGGAQIYMVNAGSVTEGDYPGVDLEFSGTMGLNFGGGTTNATKAGSGVMEVSGPVPLNGLFTLSEGTLRLSGTNSVTNFGATGVALDATNPATLQLNAATSGDSVSFSKTISGGSASAAVTKIGEGNLTFTNAKTYIGATHVDAGTLTLQGNLDAASPLTVAANASLVANTNDVAVGSVAVSSGGTVSTGTPSKSLTASALTFSGAATLKPSLAPGATPITVDSLTVSGGAGSIVLLPSGSGLVSGTSYDVLRFTGTSNITNASAFVSGARAFTPSYDAATKTIKVTYDASTTLLWTGVGSTDWNTTATNNWKLTNGTPTKFINSDVVEFPTSPSGSTTVSIWDADVLPASTTFSNTTATTYTVEGSFGIASGQLTKINNGTVVLANVNTYTGATTISGGSLQLGDGSNNGTLSPASVITNNANLTFNNGGAMVQGTDFSTTPIAGTGSLTKTGMSQVTLNAANTYTGGTTVSQGTLVLSNVNAAGTAGAITLGDANTGDIGATLNPNVGSAAFTNPITVSAAHAGTGTVTIRQTQNYSEMAGLLTLNRPTTINTSSGDRAGFSAKITGNVGTLTFTGTRTTMFQVAGNASDFTGNIEVASGTLQLTTPYGVPATASVTVNGGATFRPICETAGAVINAINGTGTIHNNSGGGAAVFPLSIGNGNGDGDFSGSLQNGSATDIVSIIKNGTGTQKLAGTLSYTGTTVINGGKLLFNSAKSGAGAVTVNAGGTLGGNGTVAGSTTIGGTLAPGDAGVGTLTTGATVITGTYACEVSEGTADKLVAGTLNITGATLTVNEAIAGTAYPYTIATYTPGGLTGAFTAPLGYVVDYSTDGVIKLAKSSSAAFNAWADSWPGLTDKTPGGDPDHDGIINLMEYVIGGDPRVSSTAFLPKESRVGGNLVLSYKRSDVSETDTTQVGQWSANLSDWHTATPVIPVLINENGSNPDDMEIRIPLSNAVGGKLFGRLSVSQ